MSTSASLYGRLVRDPEVKYLPSGTTVANLRIAVDRAGDRLDDGGYGPGFFDVTVFGKPAENVGQYLGKGAALAVFGRLSFHEWDAKDGSGKRNRVEIVADRVTFGAKSDSDGSGGGGSDYAAQLPTGAGTADDPDLDIPF